MSASITVGNVALDANVTLVLAQIVPPSRETCKVSVGAPVMLGQTIKASLLAIVKIDDVVAAVKLVVVVATLQNQYLQYL
jgi:hypothetical protein